MLAAGKGTRMGKQLLPKPLLPYRNKAIISHVVRAWSYLSPNYLAVYPETDNRVYAYLNVAHPDLRIEGLPVRVNEKSTPVTHLHDALTHLGHKFRDGDLVVVTVCDGVYEREASRYLSFLKTPGVYLGLGQQTIGTESYLMVKHEVNCYTSFVDKPQWSDIDLEGWFPWSGVLVTNTVSQLVVAVARSLSYTDSPEFVHVLTECAKVGVFDLPFLDLGTKVKYDVETAHRGFDYSKPDQVTYSDVDGRVVKYFHDYRDAQNFHSRHVALCSSGANYLLPEDLIRNQGFVSYARLPGRSMGEVNSIELTYVLDTLNQHLWTAVKGPSDILGDKALGVTKTVLRVLAYMAQTPEEKRDTEWYDLLQKAFWSSPGPGKLGLVHGDATFDNMIHSDYSLRLVDWRPILDTLSAKGDVYYDLAKIWVSIAIDLPAVRRGQFTEESIPALSESHNLQPTLHLWCSDHRFSYEEVVRRGILTMAAMCGVHKEPFASAVYAHSLKLAKAWQQFCANKVNNSAYNPYWSALL
jgi:hypothetical protein